MGIKLFLCVPSVTNVDSQKYKKKSHRKWKYILMIIKITEIVQL